MNNTILVYAEFSAVVPTPIKAPLTTL